MNISSADYAAHLRRMGMGEPPAKRRRKPGTGDFSQRKRERFQWELEQNRLPGVFIPIRVSNPLNGPQGNRWAKASERKETRKAVVVAWRAAGYPIIPTFCPATVVLTRYGPRSLDEGCGLNASLKSVRDAVAEMLCMDDADPRIAWVYKQERSKHYGVRVFVGPKG